MCKIQICLNLLLQAGMVRMSRTARVMLAVLRGLMALLLMMCRVQRAPRCSGWLWLLKVFIFLTEWPFFSVVCVFFSPTSRSSDTFCLASDKYEASHTPHPPQRNVAASLGREPLVRVKLLGLINKLADVLEQNGEYEKFKIRPNIVFAWTFLLPIKCEIISKVQ